MKEKKWKHRHKREGMELQAQEKIRVVIPP